MARQPDEYQFGSPAITIAAAANFMVDNLPYTASSRRSAYATAYNSITRAQANGALPKGKSIPAATLFGWAMSKVQWEQLTLISELPRSVAVEIEGLSGAGMIGTVAAAEPPNDVTALKALLASAILELEQKRQELADVNAKLAACLADKRRRSEIASENGKQGGRGKTK